MRFFDNSYKSYSLLLLLISCMVCCGVDVLAAEEGAPIRTPDEILEASGGEITPEVVIELFDNCTQWDAAHKAVRGPSRDKLIELGPKALPTLFKEFLPSEGLYHRIEMVTIVEKIGHPAAEYLIPYLKHEGDHARRYAAYLLGQTAAISAQDDIYKLGPLKEDQPAVEALETALKGDEEWPVLAAVVTALGAIRDPGKVNAIAAYQKHPEQSVRLAAAISLGKIPHKVAMLRLMDSLEDEEATVRGAAVLQLAGVANGDIAFDLLTDAAASRDVPERRRLYALEALARYFDTVMADNKLKAESRRTKQQKQAFKLGKRLLNDSAGEGWNIRGHAVKLVASCDHPDAKKFLEKYEQQEKHPFVLGKIKQALVAE